MPPSDVARIMSASRNGLLMDDRVPRMHMMDDRTAANDSLHLSQLITTGYGFCCFWASSERRDTVFLRSPFTSGPSGRLVTSMATA